MLDQGPYCDYSMTVRVEIPNQPGQFARIANTLAEEGVSLGAIDLVEVRRDRMVRDITFDAQSEAHANRVIATDRAPEWSSQSASGTIRVSPSSETARARYDFWAQSSGA